MPVNLKIYHNSRCRKSRAGLDYLEKKSLPFQTVEYLKEGLSREELKDLRKKLKIPFVNLIRTQEEYYKKALKGKSFTEDEWIGLIMENPKLLKRPIVVSDQEAVIGDPPENIDLIIH